MAEKDSTGEIRRECEARYCEPRHEPIEAGRVRDFLLAMNEPDARQQDEPVPVLFLLTLGRTRRPQPARGSAVNAGDEYEFFHPVFVNDTITVSRRVLAVEEKQGKSGLMYLTRAEISYCNQHGMLVATAHSSVMRWGAR